MNLNPYPYNDFIVGRLYCKPMDVQELHFKLIAYIALVANHVQGKKKQNLFYLAELQEFSAIETATLWDWYSFTCFAFKVGLGAFDEIYILPESLTVRP